MYIPRSYAEPSIEVVFDFMEAHPFATLVTAGADDLFATHLPLVLHRDEGERGTLRGHIARANEHHRQELALPEALVIFSGPDAYVSPSLYPSKAEHGKVVPTWKYAAGVVRGLSESGQEMDRRVGEMVQARRPGGT